VLIERWREYYNRVRPHSALDYRPPAPEAIVVPAMMQNIDRRGAAPAPPASSPPESTGVIMAG